MLGVGGERHLHALVEVATRDEKTVRDAIDPRVLEVPDRAGLADRLADEPHAALGLAEDLGVSGDLALRGSALFVGRVVRQRELGFAHRRSR